LREDDLRLEDFLFRDPLRGGTLAPLLRASLKPIAIACLRLFTLRPELLLSVPRLRRRIVDSTFFDADLPYFAITVSLADQHTPTSSDSTCLR
jgi:hypothetical protein